MEYANGFINNMVFGYPKTGVYQFVFDPDDSNEINIIQCFVKHVLVLCIK